MAIQSIPASGTAADLSSDRGVAIGSSVVKFLRWASIPFMLGVVISYLGFSWDVQWHTDVGPDTFFTAPHLMLYSGIAIAGLTCLVVTLVCTAAARRGDTTAITQTISVLRGRYRAPIGYLVGGLAAASFLLYGGIFDQWWHGLYGFDVTLISPPHVGLILSIFLIMIGALVAMSGDVRQARAAGASPWMAVIVLGLAASVLFSFLTPTAVEAHSLFLGIFIWPSIATTLIFATMLTMVTSIARVPGSTLVAGVVYTLLLGITWVFVPWVTREYAASVGLFVRDTANGYPAVPGFLPLYLGVAALAVEAIFLSARRRSWSMRLTAMAAGAATAVILVMVQPIPGVYRSYFETMLPPEIWGDIASGIDASYWPTVVLCAGIGALAGWFGWNLGVVLRQMPNITTRQERNP